MLTIPLDEGARSATEEEGLKVTVGRIRTAKRIVVVCCAGISTGSGIPDFRSSDGLFGKGKGKAKDLFHVRSLTSSKLLPDHHALLNELASLSNTADPSALHSYLSRLDGEGRLLRCYTQNIDGLEAQAGLEVGLPSPATLAKSPRKKTVVALANSPASPPATEPRAAPRCIPLHGQLTHLYCPLCSTTLPLSDHLPLPPDVVPCPTCDLNSSIRHALSERQRRTGHLRASVVLYGEEHPQGELIGTVVERDLRGSGRKGEKEGKVDLLLVVGTSLAIPGVKRMVKEFARSLASRSGVGQVPRSIFINRDPPKGSEWDGVFDTFVAGDIQDFVTRYIDDPAFVTSSPAAITPRTPKKRKTIIKEGFPPTPDTTPSKSTLSSTPAKKKRIVSLSNGPEVKRLQLPPTPRPTPPKQGAAPSNAPRQHPEKDRSASPLTPISDLDENPFVVFR